MIERPKMPETTAPTAAAGAISPTYIEPNGSSRTWVLGAGSGWCGTELVAGPEDRCSADGGAMTASPVVRLNAPDGPDGGAESSDVQGLDHSVSTIPHLGHSASTSSASAVLNSFIRVGARD